MTDGWFVVWRRILFAVSVFLTLFGVMAAALPFAPIFAARNAAIADAYLGGEWTAAESALHAFSSGPLGGTIAGFFAIQAIVVAVPLARRERWAWWAIASGNGLWFVVDSAVCIYHGAWFNVLQINLLSLGAVGLPLLALAPVVFRRAGPDAAGSSGDAEESQAQQA